MRASRTGVINLSPSGEWLTGTTIAARVTAVAVVAAAAAAMVVVVTNYLNARPRPRPSRGYS